MSHPIEHHFSIECGCLQNPDCIGYRIVELALHTLEHRELLTLLNSV